MKNFFGMTSLILLLIGGLNWAFVGLFSFDLVKAIFGTSTMAVIMYVAFGVAALIVGYQEFLD